MRRTLLAVASAALLMAACGGDDSPTATTTADDQTTTTAGATTTQPANDAGVLAVATSDLGTHLVDGRGYTLYIFDPDNQSDSVCYDQCEQAWPPYTEAVTPGDGVDATLLGTTTRTDGATQITYNGWPLYYFAADPNPGDTNGQGVNDVWWVMTPTGEAIR